MVDATSLHVGGGKIVLDAFILGIVDKSFCDTKFYVFTHPNYITSLKSKNVKFICPTKRAKSIHKFWRVFLYSIGFFFFSLFITTKSKKWPKILSLTNIPIFLFSVLKQVLLIHQVHLTAYGKNWRKLNPDAFPKLKHFEFNFFAFLLPLFARVQNTVVVVQTAFMKQQLQATFGESQPIEIVRQGVVLPRFEERNSSPETQSMRLFCLTRGYHHKRLEVLSKICEVVDNASLPIRIITTLGEMAYEKEILGELGGFRCHINLGPIDHARAMKELSESTALLWTSCLESLGLPVIEALALGKPIISTTHEPVSSEILKTRKIFLNPNGMNAEVLLNVCQLSSKFNNQLESRRELRRLSEEFTTPPIEYVLSLLRLT